MSERLDETGSLPELDPAISVLYRKAADLAPPPSVDAAVLAEARRALRRRRQAWILPLSTAAVVVAGLSLLLNMKDEWDFSGDLAGKAPESQYAPAAKAPLAEKPERLAPVEPPAPARREAEPFAADAVPAAEAVPPEAPPAAPARRSESKKAAPSQGDAPAEGGAPAAKSAPPVENARRARTAAESSGVLAFSKDFSSLSDSEGDQEPAGPGLDATQTKQKQAEAAGPAAAMPAEEKPAAGTLERPLEPETWLKKIRELVAAGEMESARKELESFRKHYRDYPVPKDLSDF